VLTAEDQDALVVGAGPAGLMAAEALSAAGYGVVVAEAKPSPARKFLMAGKSGLNLTKAEDRARFLAAYGAAADRLAPMLAIFGPDEVRAWAEGLDQTLFTGSTGRVFPTAMKASPLLRAWLRRLDAAGVDLRRGWRWRGWSNGTAVFDVPGGGQRQVGARVTILALGGASWARLGSDGAWAPILEAEGVPLTPFAPANAGLRIDWTDRMARHFGTPVKGARLAAGGLESRGEVVISERGLEGGGVYPLTPALRAGAPLVVDLKPGWPPERLAAEIGSAPARQTVREILRRRIGLGPGAIALLQEFARPLKRDRSLVAAIRGLTLPYSGLRPLDEAISTAGGIAWAGVDSDLMLKARPDVHVAGEMLDWEAPTGGYLLTACLATGLWAGRAAARSLAQSSAKARR
jgi:uncharacterized flavoprotein (TIGR03862 family)